MKERSYPIKTSADEVARLRMQSDLFRSDGAAMLDRLGVGLGWRCLDLCCGTGGITDLLSRQVGERGEVIGADADVAKLDVAREWARINGLDNVRFEPTDAFATGYEPGSFDLAHCRFALSVIAGGRRILDHLLTLVRPGGILFLEEVNIRTMECVPSDPAWDRGMSIMVDTFTAIGADVQLGPKLHAALADAGLTEIRVRPCVHALRAGDPMTNHLPSTIDGMRDSILSLGLSTDDELDDLVGRLRRHMARPETLTISFTMLQIAGRMPTP